MCNKDTVGLYSHVNSRSRQHVKTVNYSHTPPHGTWNIAHVCAIDSYSLHREIC